MADTDEIIDEPLPRDYAVRALLEDTSLGEGNVMRGHLALFNVPAIVDSRVEGQFIETIAPGAFKKTISEQRSRMRVIYDHGQDPSFGRHPLGPIQELHEDERGVYYEVPLLDNDWTKNLIPGLRAGVYGASFRFRPTQMDRKRPKAATPENPDRWEERTVRQLEMVEFGPTPFPVYEGATAGMRSMTDEYRAAQLGLLALPTPEPPGTPAAEAAPRPPRFRNRQEYLEWISRT